MSFLQSRMATQSEHLKGQDQTIVELKERIVEMDEVRVMHLLNTRARDFCTIGVFSNKNG